MPSREGGDLAADTVVVYDWLHSAFEPYTSEGTYWLGGFQDAQGGEPDQGWRWVATGGLIAVPPSSDSRWVAGEPDDGLGMNHDALVMVYHNGDDGLADEDETATHRAIIERLTGTACDPEEDMLLDYQRTFAWQYRYDTARARYMRRMLDPETLVRVDTEWSDYGGDWIYADWKMVAVGDGRAADGGDGKLPGTFDRVAIAEPGDGSGSGEDPTEASTVRYYLTGIAHADVGTDGAWDDQTYYHGNQISSTRLLTDSAGTVVRNLGYTAFGEEVDLGGEVGTRYRYAGGWGYESHDDFSFLHVGARWYDPETGRFLQRDPIGVRGGFNVYTYQLNDPTVSVDPSGLVPESVTPWPGGQGPWGPKASAEEKEAAGKAAKHALKFVGWCGIGALGGWLVEVAGAVWAGAAAAGGGYIWTLW